MPYSYHKEGDKYVVTKKDTGKVVGHTKGTKEALKKYLAALHINANEGKVNENKFNPPGTPADINTNDPKKALEFFEGQYKAVSERMAEIMKRQGYKVSPSTQAFTNELSDYMDMYYNAIQYTKKFIKDNNLQESNTMKKSELREMIAEIIKEVMNESVDYDTAVAYRLTVKGDRDAAMANVKALLDNLTTGKSKKFPEVKVVMLPSKGNPQDIILKLNGPGAFSMSKDIKARPELKGIKVSTYKPQLSKIS